MNVSSFQLEIIMTTSPWRKKGEAPAMKYCKITFTQHTEGRAMTNRDMCSKISVRKLDKKVLCQVWGHLDQIHPQLKRVPKVWNCRWIRCSGHTLIMEQKQGSENTCLLRWDYCIHLYSLLEGLPNRLILVAFTGFETLSENFNNEVLILLFVARAETYKNCNVQDRV